MTAHDTLYPSITNKPDDIAYHLSRSLTPHSGPLALIGTVKLHGTHGDIVITAPSTITFQSRNQLSLTPGLKTDNVKFAESMLSHREAILALSRRYTEHYRTLHPGAEIDTTRPVVLAGEWIGLGIQTGVGISSLPRAFVICSVAINGVWLSDASFSGVEFEAPEARIFHISRGGFYHATIKFDDLEGSMQRLRSTTDAVCEECPFAKAFGASGIGEGIVWKAVHDPGNPRLWLKTKGPAFQPKPVKVKQAQAKALSEQEAVASRFAEEVAHERRMEQGLEVLRERNEPVSSRAAKMFAEWVLGDVIKEDWREVREGKVSAKDAEKFVRRLAFAWFREELERRKEG